MKKFSFILFLLFTATILAQSTVEKPFIEITGIAETEIVPDEIYLDICIKERTEKGKKLTLDYLENELKSVLKKIGIHENNLVISDVNAVLAKTGWWSEEILSVGNYTLKVNGAEKLKQLFENFKKMNISDVNITKATHSNIIELRKKNRIKAIKIAKEKADYLLSAIGEQTGKPIIIRELENNNSNFVNAKFINSSRSYSSFSKTGGSINEIVEFQKIKITSSLYVKFQIK
ncbi:MAG: SIMPL domain-containing protein [Polaribacter sp.]|uniref:SIMPL domain-containing protein n=1 Tax=Polaribacter sp. TaxID=1920175 RepID=UPI003BB1A19F